MPHSTYLTPTPLARDVIRELDATTIREYGVPGIVLMENAGEACVRAIEELLESEPDRIKPPFQIVCGFGNNAGDGFVIARHLHNRSIPVHVHMTASRDKLKPDSDASINFEACRRMGVAISEPGGHLQTDIEQATIAGTIVDAIFGSGLCRAVETPQIEWIEAINASKLGVLAIDIPSGLDADTGAIHGVAVRADHTFTFVAAKLGFDSGPGPEHVGKVRVMGISIPRKLIEPHCQRH